mmetsp:Transcript_52851/g.87791  ORF Transcript_52851/g.87791 Transcript_52851/m.87791 type:complete len:333 (-) Transcript_52851:86-1084(-)
MQETLIPLRDVIARCLEEWEVSSQDETDSDDFCGWRPIADVAMRRVEEEPIVAALYESTQACENVAVEVQKMPGFVPGCAGRLTECPHCEIKESVSLPVEVPEESEAEHKIDSGLQTDVDVGTGVVPSVKTHSVADDVASEVETEPEDKNCRRVWLPSTASQAGAAAGRVQPVQKQEEGCALSAMHSQPRIYLLADARRVPSEAAHVPKVVVQKRQLSVVSTRRDADFHSAKAMDDAQTTQDEVEVETRDDNAMQSWNAPRPRYSSNNLALAASLLQRSRYNPQLVPRDRDPYRWASTIPQMPFHKPQGSVLLVCRKPPVSVLGGHRPRFFV